MSYLFLPVICSCLEKSTRLAQLDSARTAASLRNSPALYAGQAGLTRAAVALLSAELRAVRLGLPLWLQPRGQLS